MSSADSSTPPMHMERSALRGYNSEVADLVLKAVNDFGATYRFTNSSVILYPQDGSKPFTVRARERERGIKLVQRWFVQHCVPEDMAVDEVAAKVKVKAVDEAVVKDLAEAVNSEEHLAPVAKPHPAKPAPEPEPVAAAPEPVEEPVEEPAEEPERHEWVQYYTGRGKGHEDAEGKPHPYYVTDGVNVKCTIDGWIGKKAGTGGHSRTKHSDAEVTLWGSKARSKAEETRRITRLTDSVAAAITQLQDAIGVKPEEVDVTELTDQIESLKEQLNKVRHEDTKKSEQITALREENGKQATKIVDLGTQVTDLKAKVALLREAFAALED